MVLIPSLLSQTLAAQWLPGENGPFHDDAQASADVFAQAVSGWFGAAQAAGFPCATASVRKSQLSAMVMAAIGTGAAMTAGQQVTLAFAAYVAGQSFGSGVAAPPMATSAGDAMISAAFLDRDQPQSARADRIAAALHLMAISSLVAFPQPPFTAPVM